MTRRVVITGIGCLSPNGNSREAFFDALCQGRSGIRQISRFDASDLACQVAGEIRDFDPLRWVSKKDAPHVPLTVPFGVAAGTQAIKDAGLEPEALSLEERRRFGVMIGSGGGGVEFMEKHYQLFFADDLHQASVYAIPSNTMGTLSSELSMHFNLKGLSHVISTGCTSSTDAIGYAAEHIRAGRLDRVLCGGIDAPITAGTMAGFCLMKVVSRAWNHAPEQASRPFSRDRDGFVLGEGAWLFVLEDEALAKSRGAKIYAEVAGYGATCDAYHRVRLDESGEEPARAMQMALEDAGLNPGTDGGAIDYINLHGTSTQLNDRIETRALKLAFGKRAYDIPASSTKSMIGHPQGASGSAGVAAALCAMETQILPPTVNLSDPDPECDLDYVPETGRRHAVEWVVCNCIGFGSKNSALVLRKYSG
ncbi:MAG TPA: beta-ketoacyl-[acyl-carrier-protein] synthase family protein [Coleofasciculaceae cyanobacterium]|jgi:3-oxoacyl-[acyl-carrier-protein] synthase II